LTVDSSIPEYPSATFVSSNLKDSEWQKLAADISRVLPTRLTTNASDLYPRLATCPSFDNCIAVALDYVRVKNDHTLSEEYGKQCCANGSKLNKSIITSHIQSFRQFGVLETIARTQRQHADIFLQVQDVKANYQAFPEYNTLLELAEEGATICTPPDFTFNNGVGACSRPICSIVPSAIHARLSQEQLIGDSIIVPQSVLKQAAALAGLQFHVSELSWVFKPGDAESNLLGRLVDDYTNSAGGGLNGEHTMDEIIRLYGSVTNPQLADLCRAYLASRDPSGHDPLDIATEDVGRAYRRAKVRPPHCLMLVLNLPPIEGVPPLYSIGLSGRFGYCGAGHVWAVAARALKWRFDLQCRALRSTAYGEIYVDDLTFFPRQSHSPRLITFWAHICESLCGTDARQEAKANCGPVTPTIGWVFSQPDDRVFVSEKGFLSLVACFFGLFPIALHPKQPVLVLTLMRAAQLTLRYSASMFTMAPFCSGFYRDLQGVKNSRGTRRVSFRTVCDVWAWRAHLFLCFDRLADLSIPIAWPALRQLSVDELIRRARTLVYVDAASNDPLIGVYIVNKIWSQFNFPSATYFHNRKLKNITIALLEMCGIVAGALLALQDTEQPPHSTPHHVHIVTDNTNAYYWSLSNKSSTPVLYFFLQMLTLIAAKGNLLITHSWTSSATNPVADAISRNFREPGMDKHLTLLRNTCRRVEIPPVFLQTIAIACEQPLTTALATVRLALTPLDGTSS
jgi:hypothetical protein